MGMILPIVTFLPLVGALLCLALPREEEQIHRGVGLGTALVTFLTSLFLLPGLEPTKMNHVVDFAWVESLGIRFHLGIDGISIWLVLLTTFLMPIVFLSTWSAISGPTRTGSTSWVGQSQTRPTAMIQVPRGRSTCVVSWAHCDDPSGSAWSGHAPRPIGWWCSNAESWTVVTTATG